MYEPRLLGLPIFRSASITGAAGVSGFGFGGVLTAFITVGIVTSFLLLVICARFVARRTVSH